MKNAEQVTFGGGNIDRAAQLRDDPQALAEQWQTGQVLVMWRGKPLCQLAAVDDVPGALAWLPATHPVVKGQETEAVFLGRCAEGVGRFAIDISTWEPEAQDTDSVGGFVDLSEQRHPELPQDSGFAELRRIMAHLNRAEAEFAATARAIFGWHETHRFCARCGEKSNMAQAGWQRICPSCGGAHFPRTDPVVIMLITHGESVLVGRSPGWPEGMYSLLAGFVEPGETLEAAVRREVEEETGVKVGAVSYLSSQPWPFPMSLMFGCAGEALGRDIKIDPNEIEDALWVSRQDMMTVFAGDHPTIRQPRKGAIAHFLLQNWLADTLD